MAEGRVAATRNSTPGQSTASSGPMWIPIQVKQGKRYRLMMANSSGDQHPMRLYRHSFEVVQIGDKKLSGLKKDVVNVMPLDTVAVDFVADNPGGRSASMGSSTAAFLCRKAQGGTSVGRVSQWRTRNNNSGSGAAKQPARHSY